MIVVHIHPDNTGKGGSNFPNMEFAFGRNRRFGECMAFLKNNIADISRKLSGKKA